MQTEGGVVSPPPVGVYQLGDASVGISDGRSCGRGRLPESAPSGSAGRRLQRAVTAC